MSESSQNTPIVIAGAGLCGLSAAYHLEKSGFRDYVLIEGNLEVGGLARTETYDGFSFDHSIHILYTKDAYAADLICNRLLADNLRKQARESYCYTSGVYTEYPYQANNYGLPPEVIIENIMGIILARYELFQQPMPIHFEEWIQRTFGKGIANHFMIPYNRKQWAWDLKQMHYDWIADRVPLIQVTEVLRGALKPPEKKYGPNREFWYPEQGGIESLVKAFDSAIPVERKILGMPIKRIEGKTKTVVLADGRSLRYEFLFSSLPLPRIFQLLDQALPPEVQKSAAGLKHNTVHTVNIGLEGTHLGTDRLMHWIYYPGEDTLFHRISFPHHFSPSMVPRNCASIQAEISESCLKPIDRGRLIEETFFGLCRVGILTPQEAKPVEQGGRVRVAQVVTLDPAYIIYDLNHRKNVNTLFKYLETLKIKTRGRFGEWEYMNMDHAILSGKSILDCLQL